MVPPGPVPITSTPLSSLDIPGCSQPLQVLWRDRTLLVVCKPSGISSQSERAGDADVLAALAATEGPLWCVHRLDRPASGLLALARTREAAAHLSAQLERRAARRSYAAVCVAPGATADEATWDRPLDGKPATTRVRWLGRAEGMAAAWLQLDSGRLHQIRRHASAAGSPLLGDRRYAGDAGRWWPRLALHAAALELEHPETGQRLAWASPIPPDLAALWARAGGPEPLPSTTTEPPPSR